jgi:glucose-6-phosphate isomerase, archaeal
MLPRFSRAEISARERRNRGGEAHAETTQITGRMGSLRSEAMSMVTEHGKTTVAEPIRVDLSSGFMGTDPRVERTVKTLGQMKGVFLDEQARCRMDPAQVMYALEYWKPVPDGTEGGLFLGNSTVFPGRIGEEYFMTRGHFHAKRDRAEFYSTASGTGMLVMMDEQRRATVQEMSAGSTHYIPGRIAHRVVNTGAVPLTFLACWPSDAGYDYAAIDEQGFTVRVLRRNEVPEVVVQS